MNKKKMKIARNKNDILFWVFLWLAWQYSNTQMKITSKPICKHKSKSLSISLCFSVTFPCSSLAILKLFKTFVGNFSIYNNAL